eukprot:jgi/Tetstr1/466581/TSEL_000989.t1
MFAASTASKNGPSSDGGIMRLRKPVCRTAHTTSNRMAPWCQPYPDVPKEAMRSNSVAWASRRRPNAPPATGQGAVDHLSDVDMVHMPAEMSMETAVPIDFQETWAEAQRCVNERVVAAVEADDPAVLDRALKWKYMLLQLLIIRAPSRDGRRRRQQALAWRFRAFAERRMTELVRSWDDARTEAFYAGHARHRRTDADLFAALLMGTVDTVVALVEDEELSRAAGRLSSKGMGDLSDPAILAKLRDKHPSRSHPIRDAAYSGRRGRPGAAQRVCLVGEYAPASGPAAVRAMSEVASMYLQVGEAERRAAERAIVVLDNMKEAYVSGLAPSQLGVGIPAGDSMLIHGVRLIAEKLGPRAVIVHTDLRNAYNDAWRRTIIQRHIECFPLHHVILALLASLSTDSYLVVDDRSAPLRSEDGVQHGAPLATTSFCVVAIHPEVQHCDITLEVTDGAARFNADDGFCMYVQAYMRGKAEELREEVDASLSKLLSAKPNRQYTHALHHHAWALLKHCLQHKAGYWLRNCLPSEMEGFAVAVDATVLAAVGRVLGVSFDPSTYGTGTNPVVTDFLAELLHDPDPMAAELGSVLGRGSFNATSSARRFDHFLNDAHGSDSYAAEMREAWGTAILFNQLDAASGMWTVAIPTARTVTTLQELREVAAVSFFLPSPCLAPVVGSQFFLPSTEHNPVTVDLYGDALMNLPRPGDAHWRVQHDAIADAFLDHCVHDLGIAVRREVDDLFQQAVPLGNTVPKDELKDLVPDAKLFLPAFNVVTRSYDPRRLKSTLLEFKAMRYGVKYTAVPRATAVDRFERSLLGDIQRGLAARDAAWHNTEPGPLRDILDMSEYTGLVFGTVGGVLRDLRGDPAATDLSAAPTINFTPMAEAPSDQLGDIVHY